MAMELESGMGMGIKMEMELGNGNGNLTQSTVKSARPFRIKLVEKSRDRGVELFFNPWSAY